MLQPPTDNLYKFCAISGLLILFFTLYYTINTINNLNIEITNTETKQGNLSIKHEHLRNKVNGIAENVECAETLTDNLKENNNEETKATAIQKIRTVEDKLLQYQENILELNIINNEIMGEVKIVKTKLAIIKSYYWLLGFSIFTGLSLSLFGFIKWYVLQIKLDKKI
jgi:hypothetical protein